MWNYYTKMCMSNFFHTLNVKLLFFYMYSMLCLTHSSWKSHIKRFFLCHITLMWNFWKSRAHKMLIWNCASHVRKCLTSHENSHSWAARPNGISILIKVKYVFALNLLALIKRQRELMGEVMGCDMQQRATACPDPGTLHSNRSDTKELTYRTF